MGFVLLFFAFVGFGVAHFRGVVLCFLNAAALLALGAFPVPWVRGSFPDTWSDLLQLCMTLGLACFVSGPIAPGRFLAVAGRISKFLCKAKPSTFIRLGFWRLTEPWRTCHAGPSPERQRHQKGCFRLPRTVSRYPVYICYFLHVRILNGLPQLNRTCRI